MERGVISVYLCMCVCMTYVRMHRYLCGEIDQEYLKGEDHLDLTLYNNFREEL